jgi:hypothetical protein
MPACLCCTYRLALAAQRVQQQLSSYQDVREQLSPSFPNADYDMTARRPRSSAFLLITIREDYHRTKCGPQPRGLHCRHRLRVGG